MEGLHTHHAYLVPERLVDVTRASRLAVAAALFVLAVGACAAGGASPPPDDVAHYTPEGPGGGEAQLLGRLVRLDGCIYVVDTRSDSRSIPVFPDDQAITWNGETLETGSRALTLDEEVEMGGGEGSSGTPGVTVPDACDKDTPLFIVNS